MTERSILPYCGSPPLPSTLWFRWNADPILLAVLVAAAWLYWLGSRRAARTPAVGTQSLFYAGWTIAAASLISPLCALSVSLFAARLAQHAILALVAAPLVAAGRPLEAYAAALGLGERPAAPARPFFAALLFGAMIWLWHAPVPYAATFASSKIYWLMQVTVFTSAFWLWSALVEPSRGAGALVPVLAGLMSSVQMGLLGALITLSPRAFYAPHALTTMAWGLTPLQDQQLGGSIMWVPGCIVFLVVAMFGLRRVLEPARFLAGLVGP